MLIRKKWSCLLDNHFFIFFSFLIVVLITYYPVFDFTFFQDDFVWLSHAKDIWAGSANIFTLRISNFIMPTVYGYFAFTFKLFGLNSALFYFTNILLHSLNGFLLFQISKKLLPKYIALFSSLIFLVLRYPLEAVSWISAVTVLLVTFFLLLIGLLWILFLELKSKKYYFLVIIFTLLLILTKEWSVLVIPFIILLHILFQIKEQRPVWNKKYFYLFLPILTVFALYLGYEKFVQQGSSVLISEGYYAFGLHAIPNIINNIFLTFVPLTNFANTQPILWLTVSSIFLITTFIAGSYIFIKKKNPLVLGIVWMIVSFLPTSFFTWDPYTSRYSYIPALGAVLFLGYSFKFLINSKNKKWLLKSISIILIFYGLLNIIFVHRVLNNLYGPIHEENKYFTNALLLTEQNLDKNNDIAIYYSTPHKAFILPEILHTLVNIPTENIHVIHYIEECNQYSQCLFWNSDKKIIELL